MTNLNIKKRFPYKVKIIDNVWIPLSDGCKLAAKIFKPVSLSNKKIPAILEYIPYRKNDYTSVQDYAVHKYFAGHGYVSVRVDMRGSGESDGLLLDEYLKIEQKDGFEVVNWLSNQTWCNGNVGMIGYSWGGITSMQVASLNPKGLKAIIPVTASVDRYYDDAGYFVGCLVGQTIGWGVEMDSLSTRPPDPLIVGSKWKKIWKHRLEKTPPYVPIWLSNQEKNKYWLQGTISKNYDLIKCPVLSAGGWADCWPNTVGRLVKNLNVNVKGISGPWGHNYSCFAKPGPQIGFFTGMSKMVG
jgi:putative CocE/NonD family hydrolase